MKHHRSSLRSLFCVALAFMGLLAAAPVSAAVVGNVPAPVVHGPAGLTNLAPVLTNAINNDNDGSPFNPPNRLEVLELQFTGTQSIDIVYPISDSGGVTEYAMGLGTTLGFISTSIINSSGAAWSGMQVSLGTGFGAGFTPSSLSSGHDFDIPHGDPLPASDVFPYFQNWGNKMNFLGGTVPSSIPSDLAAHFIMTTNMDLPDGLGSEFTLRLTPLLADGIGSVQDNPILPTSTTPNVYYFAGVTRAKWFDPPTAAGFEYTMTNPGDLFTKILAFPTGFADDFEVLVGGISQGFFNSSSPEFVFAGGGVDSFQIRGINPLVDPSNPTAFPLMLDFNNPTASFSMTALDPVSPVPEPSGLLLAGCGLLVIGRVRRGRRG